MPARNAVQSRTYAEVLEDLLVTLVREGAVGRDMARDLIAIEMYGRTRTRPALCERLAALRVRIGSIPD